MEVINEQENNVFSKKYSTYEEYYEKYKKPYMKIWNEENKDNLKEYFDTYNKNYYEKNADKLKEKVVCECGGHYIKINKNHHIKTIKHQKYIQNKIQSNNEC
jgi:hypothetical protein